MSREALALALEALQHCCFSNALITVRDMDAAIKLVIQELRQKKMRRINKMETV